VAFGFIVLALLLKKCRAFALFWCLKKSKKAPFLLRRNKKNSLPNGGIMKLNFKEKTCVEPVEISPKMTLKK